MKIYWDEIEVYADEYLKILDITEDVKKVVDRSGIKNGHIIVHNPKPTSGLAINEHDEDLWKDLLDAYQRLVPMHSRDYRHDAKYRGIAQEENTHGHILNTFIGSNVTILIRDGALVLGTWQKILYMSIDNLRACNLLKYTCSKTFSHNSDRYVSCLLI